MLFSLGVELVVDCVWGLVVLEHGFDGLVVVGPTNGFGRRSLQIGVWFGWFNFVWMMFSWLCLVWLGVELGGNVVHNGIWVLFVGELFSELLWLLKKKKKTKICFRDE